MEKIVYIHPDIEIDTISGIFYIDYVVDDGYGMLFHKSKTFDSKGEAIKWIAKNKPKRKD